MRLETDGGTFRHETAACSGHALHTLREVLKLEVHVLIIVYHMCSWCWLDHYNAAKRLQTLQRHNTLTFSPSAKACLAAKG